MAVMTFAMVVIFYAFSVSMRILSEEMIESDVSLETHKAVERMVSELRNSLEIVSGGSTSIIFWYRDTNGDTTREADETVSYYWTAGTVEALFRQQGSSTIREASGIINFSLTYDNPSSIKLIKILITAKKGGTLGTLESSVKSRNL